MIQIGLQGLIFKVFGACFVKDGLGVVLEPAEQQSTALVVPHVDGAVVVSHNLNENNFIINKKLTKQNKN
jgi:hypothetical protein